MKQKPYNNVMGLEAFNNQIRVPGRAQNGNIICFGNALINGEKCVIQVVIDTKKDGIIISTAIPWLDDVPSFDKLPAL